MYGLHAMEIYIKLDGISKFYAMYQKHCGLFKARLSKTKTRSVQTGNYIPHCAKYPTTTLHCNE